MSKKKESYKGFEENEWVIHKGSGYRIQITDLKGIGKEFIDSGYVKKETNK